MPDDKTPYDTEAISDISREYSKLPVDRVRHYYREAYAKCQLADCGLPDPKAMQTLVILWKLLWSWRK